LKPLEAIKNNNVKQSEAISYAETAPSAIGKDAEKLTKKESKKIAKKQKKAERLMKKLEKIKARSEDGGKVAAIVGYLGLIGFLISLLAIHEKGEEFSAFHLRQSLGLTVVGLALSLLWIIPIVGWIAAAVGGLLVFISWIIGLVGAINGTTKPVFFLGEQFQKWFSGIE
ncbi:MAG: hypothetical protein AAFO82_08715, partial [Bacteroidota bacterium]